MLKYFARILLITLTLTAPLSFTGDVCPDFKPACDTRSIHSAKTTATVAAVRISCISTTASSDSFVTLNLTNPPDTLPIDCYQLPTRGRSPPSFPALS